MSTGDLPRGSRLVLTVARRILAPEDVERVVLPALADGSADGVAALLAACSAEAGERLRRAPRAHFLPATAALMLGALLLVRQPGGRGLATAHIAFAGVGLSLSALVVAIPRRLARPAGLVATGVALVALLLTAACGDALEGARRWLTVGPLHVDVGTLALPFLAHGTVLLATARRPLPRACALAVAVTVGGVLALARHGGAAVIFAAALAAASSVRAARSRVALPALVALGAAVVTLARHRALAPVPHVEGALRLLATIGPAPAVAATLALALLGLLTFASASRAGAAAAPSARAAATAVALAPWISIASGDGVPLVAFGGSAVVATLAALGLVSAQAASVDSTLRE